MYPPWFNGTLWLDKEDFDLASALKMTIHSCTTLSEQIWLCDLEKQKMVAEEKYEVGLKIAPAGHPYGTSVKNRRCGATF